MNATYQAWIRANVDHSYGQCVEVTRRMKESCPELERIRGHYYCTAWGEREHWWLIDSDGNVVDPTAEQFPSNGRGVYIPWNEGTPEPTGMCPNCGEHCFDGDYFCSDKCGKEYVAFCSG